MLFELCQKQGKELDIIHWKKETKSIVSVYVDGELVASDSSEQKEIAKLNAAKGALRKLSHSMPCNDGLADILESIVDHLRLKEQNRSCMISVARNDGRNLVTSMYLHLQHN